MRKVLVDKILPLIALSCGLYVLIVLLLMQTSCSDSDLQKVAKSSLIVATVIGQVQTDTMEANKTGLIDDQTAGQILAICQRANVAGKQINSVLRGLSKLDQQSRASIFALLVPIGQSLETSKIEFVAGIKNPETRQKVEGGLILARSTISTIMIIVASSGGD